MADIEQNQDQDQGEPYQLTGDQLSEMHGLAQQLQAANDPRAQRLWNFIAAQSGGGDGSEAPKFSVSQSPPKVTSWLEDLENDLWGSKAEAESSQVSQNPVSNDDTEDNESDSAANASSASNEPSHADQETAGGSQEQQGSNDVEQPGDPTGGDAGGADDTDSAEGWDLEQGRYTPPDADDIANGNYIKVGFRRLLKGPKIPYHSYIKIPVIGPDGKPADPDHGFERWGILGNDKSSENQQVRNDSRNDQLDGYKGKEVLVKVTPEQREALRERMKYFDEVDPETGKNLHPCPVCGPNYRRLSQNSNTFVYNMLFWNPAGMIWAPKPPRWTVKYGENMGDIGWYSDPAGETTK